MKRKLLLLTGCAAALFVPFTAVAEEGKKYVIKLDRPEKVGMKTQEEYRAVRENSQRATLDKGREVLTEEVSEVKMELTGEQEVLEVTAKGDVKKLSIKVEKFTLQEEQNPVKEPFKRGTVLTVSPGEGDTAKIEADGKKVEGLAAEMLDEVLTVVKDTDKHEDEDRGYSTKEPRAPGSEWNVDPNAFLADMPDDMPFTVKPEDVKGKAKFLSVKKFDGVECYEFEAAVVMKPDKVVDLPENFKVQESAVSMVAGRLAPADAALPIPVEKLKMQLEMSGTAASPDGDITLTLFVRSVHERTSRPVK